MNSLVNSSRGDVADLHPGVEVADVVADGVQQVGLAQTGVAVDQQWVVGLAGCLGHGDGRRVREAVGRADHEGLEGVLRVEPGLGRRRLRNALVEPGGERGLEPRLGQWWIYRQVAMETDRVIGFGSRWRGGLRRLQRGIDGDGEPDVSGERLGEGVLELAPQPALELGAGELVGHRDDRGALVERHRFAVAQPGLLVGLQVLDHLLPGLVEAPLLRLRPLLHRVSPPSVVRCPE